MAATYRGLEGIGDDLARERTFVQGRSESYVRALDLLPGLLAGDAGAAVRQDWAVRTFTAWYDRPLLLLAALRDDALATGQAHPLHAAFTGERPDPGAVTPDALVAALAPERGRLHENLRRRGVQTNETSRAVTWLWPARLLGLGTPARPLALADLGASAGLNLVADELPDVWTDETGAPLEVAGPLHAVARLGLDAAPLDATDEEDSRWLLACVWPGEHHRELRLLRALTAFKAARTRLDAPVLAPVRARAWPERLDLLSGTHTDAVVLAYQTIVRDYILEDERREYEDGMRAWIATHPPGRALWAELELLADAGPGQAAIQLTRREADGLVRTRRLARCHPHPTRVERDLAAVTELVRLSPAPAPAGPRPPA
ncbi:MAG: DUF2332 family protein [Anaeromyxobacteraceae bacterium]